MGGSATWELPRITLLGSHSSVGGAQQSELMRPLSRGYDTHGSQDPASWTRTAGLLIAARGRGGSSGQWEVGTAGSRACGIRIWEWGFPHSSTRFSFLLVLPFIFVLLLYCLLFVFPNPHPFPSFPTFPSPFLILSHKTETIYNVRTDQETGSTY